MSDFDFDELDKAVAGVIGDENTPQSPISEVVKPEEPATTPIVEEKTPVGPPATRRSSGRFMDVVHPSSDMRTKGGSFTPPVSKPVEEKTAEVPSSEAADESWSQPLESPFLPDAKVEKRPLGAFALDVAPQLALEEPEEELLLEAPDEPRIEAHTMPDPIDFAAHSSALPSESEDTGAPVVEETVAPKEPLEVVSEAAEVHEVAFEETPVAPVEAAPAPIPDEPVGPASITQQYTEQPSSAPSSGAIYDTENYHKPLAPVEKKHSGVWVALGIILLVILGAGAGVAFYMFVLPML